MIPHILKSVAAALAILILSHWCSAQSLFVDYFDDPDMSEWALWGSPSPLQLVRIHDRQGIFDNNGDPNFNNGATSIDSFDISNGFVLQADVYLDVWDYEGCWNDAGIGISKSEPEWWGGYDPFISLAFFPLGASCWGAPDSLMGHSYVYGYYWSDTGWVNIRTIYEPDPFVADSLVNSWQTLKIVVDSATRLPNFYIGDNLIGTGPVQVGDSVTQRARRLWLGSRSSAFGGKSYHDMVGFSAGEPPPMLEVVGPGVGDVWDAGQQGAGIEWAYANLTGTIHIDLYRDGTYLQQIATDVPVAFASVTWNVPDGLETGNDYQIRVQSDLVEEVLHLGPMFSITAPYVPPQVFFDSFSDTAFTEWTQFGSPLPRYVAGALGRQGLFDNNGDGAYISGAITNDRLDFSRGFEISTDLLLDFFNPAGCWAEAYVGIADTLYNASWGGYERWLQCGLHAIGDACAGIPFEFRRHTYFLGYYPTDIGYEYVGGTIWSDAIQVDEFANGWHTVRVVIDSSDWRPQFFIDDTLLYSGVSPLAWWIRQTPMPLYVGGESSGSAGRAYHDWVRLDSLQRSSIGPASPSVAREFRLEQNYPNPFNSSTQFSFELPRSSIVQLKVFDILGREVATIVDMYLSAGKHQINWDSRSLGDQIASGVYLYQVRAGSFRDTKKMVLLK